MKSRSVPGTSCLNWPKMRQPLATTLLATLAAAFGPYLVFHMLFQETVTTRYALPLVVPIALLAAIGVISLAPKYHAWLLGGAAALSLAIGHGTLVALAGADAPATDAVTASVSITIAAVPSARRARLPRMCSPPLPQTFTAGPLRPRL